MPTLGETVRAYLAALSEMAPPDRIAGFFHPDVVQVEYPNRLVPEGATRDLAAILAAAGRGAEVTRAQSFALTRMVEEGDCVAIEFDWWAELKVPIGSLPPGGRVTGHFASFIEFRDGLIWRQRSYDCFDPF